MTNKEQILKLRAEGITLTEIAKRVGCSKTLVCYHLYPNVRAASDKLTNERNKRVRPLVLPNLKKQRGGKCEICGYSKCLEALEFHHRNPEQKLFALSSASARGASDERLLREVAKCDLICANCHRELHTKLKTQGEGR